MKDYVLKEAARLHAYGFAIIWLKPKTKEPIGSGWTTGPRKSWEQLAREYRPGNNIGVRLGTPSKVGAGYLTVIDIDVKSGLDEHRKEAWRAANSILKKNGHVMLTCPVVESGYGNGSRHVYVLTEKPFKTWNPAESETIVKARIPSKSPSKKEREEIPAGELKKGIRYAKAWQVSFYSDGRQCVLPPSIHPDTGKQYEWRNPLGSVNEIPLVHLPVEPDSDVSNSNTNGVEKTNRKLVSNEKFSFTPSDVDVRWIDGISEKMRASIVDGKGVTDRSAFLMTAGTALLSAGLDRDEVLSVLTDHTTYLGKCAYEHAKTKNRERAAFWLYRYTLRTILSSRAAVADAFSEESLDAPKLTGKELEDQNAELHEEAWRGTLEKTQQGQYKKSLLNTVIILENAVAPNLFVQDAFAMRDAYGVDAPWGRKKNDVLNDNDAIKIKHWLAVNWGLEVSTNTIFEAMIVIAEENSYHPVREYLRALPPWDRKKRLNTWLARHFEAKGDPEYLAQVFRKYMVAAVTRIFEPGAKFDWMPILEGAQGVGKSSFAKMLVGDKWHVDRLPDLDDKDAALGLRGIWIFEMGELANIGKTQIEAVKSFITRQIDRPRAPYGKRELEIHRQSVYMGTTNRKTYLVDDSGNRRFKPVEVGQLDFDQFRKDRDQLFAEALHIYDNRLEKTLELEGAAKVFELHVHGEKMVQDEGDLMLEKLHQYEGLIDGDKLKLGTLFSVGGPLTDWRPDGKNIRFASKALRAFGYETHRVGGQNYWRKAKEGTPPHQGYTDEEPYDFR